MFHFYLGTHMPNWLTFAPMPLFVSRRTLSKYRRRLPERVHVNGAPAPWGNDSGGFTELQMFGKWSISAEDYVAEVQRYHDEIGGLALASPRDWMCEDMIIKGGWFKGVYFVGTKLSVREHQENTVNDFLTLKSLAPHLPWMPVLQGWTLTDYLECMDLYARAGVDLTREPIVGVGTVCRRQGTKEAEQILAVLSSFGLNLHGFGFKKTGLINAAPSLVSADSMAWSMAARREGRHPDCEREQVKHKNCANCFRYARDWYTDVARIVEKHHARSRQLAFAA